MLLTIAAITLAACGSDAPSSPPGSAENPLPAQTASPGTSAREPVDAPAADAVDAAKPGSSGEPASTAEPGYQALLDAQPRHPRKRFTPCNLVTAAQAGAILGAQVHTPVEAPQGPTCIYRTRDGARFVTVAVQAAPFNRLKQQLREPRRIAIADRAAYCGTYGQSVLYVPLTKGRVLSVAAPCSLAHKFAARALREFPA